MDYLSLAAKSGKKAALSKSVATKKMSISRQSLYYQPITPAKDLALKQQIETVLLSIKLVAIGVSLLLLTLILKGFGE